MEKRFLTYDKDNELIDLAWAYSMGKGRLFEMFFGGRIVTLKGVVFNLPIKAWKQLEEYLKEKNA